MSSDRDAEPGAPPGAPAAPGEPAAPAGPKPEASGSIDVAVSGPLPAASSSGSIDVALSGPLERVAPAAAAEAPPAAAAAPPDAVPAAVPRDASEPLSSGRVTRPAVGAHDHPARARRLSEAAREALGGGVTKLGTGIGTLGENISRLGERSHKVPLVGPGVTALGESLTTVGESLSELPRMARTRRGRLLVRSTVVAFLLVFAWIAVIVALQVRGVDTPDFRPTAESILRKLSEGTAGIEQVYEEASPRFQEMARKDRFVDDMTDMIATIGAFREITAVNESLVTTGPAGRIGRVSLTVSYEKGKTRGTVSLHWYEGRWRLLGLGVDVPPELKITKAQREERVQACKDPMDPKKCDLFVAANRILEQLRDGRAGEVWDAATKVFQKQEEKGRFVVLQAEHAATLGEYRRIIAVTEAKLYSGGSIAIFDVLTEYAKSQGVRATFGFYRGSRQSPWKLRSLKVVLPMPRADDPAGAGPEPRSPEPGAGSGSAGGSAAPPS